MLQSQAYYLALGFLEKSPLSRGETGVCQHSHEIKKYRKNLSIILFIQYTFCGNFPILSIIQHLSMFSAQRLKLERVDNRAGRRNFFEDAFLAKGLQLFREEDYPETFGSLSLRPGNRHSGPGVQINKL